MSRNQGLRQVGYFDCAGGGQVIVQDDIAYIGHMRSPHGTSIVDVSDPANCRELASLSMPPGTHSHKARVGNGLMIVNHETNGADPNPAPENFHGGIGIYDISNSGHLHAGRSAFDSNRPFNVQRAPARFRVLFADWFLAAVFWCRIVNWLKRSTL